MIIVDYIFYRFATWFYKGDAGGSRAGMLVSLIWSLLVFVPVVWLLNYFNQPHWIQQHLKLITGLFIGIWIPVVYANYRRYAAAYEALHRKWGNESAQKKTIGGVFALAVFLLVVSSSFTILHNMDF